MAIYHFTCNIINRNSNFSPVAAAAYRAGEKLYNEREGLTHDYTTKDGVIYKNIFTPLRVPEWVNNRERLWNEVDKIEKRKDAQTARQIELALPRELTPDQQINLLKDFVNDNFVKKGMIADTVIHDKKDGNPHSHIMLTTRPIDINGFKNKNRDWNSKDQLMNWRENWAKFANQALKSHGIDDKIDHRNYKDQGVEKIPSIRLKKEDHRREKKGIPTHRGNLNREIKNKNLEIEKLNNSLKDIDKKLNDLQQETTQLKNQKAEQQKKDSAPKLAFLENLQMQQQDPKSMLRSEQGTPKLNDRETQQALNPTKTPERSQTSLSGFNNQKQQPLNNPDRTPTPKNTQSPKLNDRETQRMFNPTNAPERSQTPLSEFNNQEQQRLNNPNRTPSQPNNREQQRLNNPEKLPER